MKFMILPISNQNLMKKKIKCNIISNYFFFCGEGGGGKGDKMKYNNWQS